jgi:hypothetical protein
MNKNLLSTLTIIAAISFSLLVFGMVYENTLPKIVEEINNASIGAILGAIVTVLLLKGQTDNEKEREKDVRIFEEKLSVFSEFSKEVWKIVNDDTVDAKELMYLRDVCFSKLVYFLNLYQVKELTDKINSLKKQDNMPNENQRIVAEISLVLKKAINSKENSVKELKPYKDEDFVIAMTNLFRAYSPEEISEEVVNHENDLNSNDNNSLENIIKNVEDSNEITTVSNYKFWHFNSLSNIQFKAFEENKWYLSLIEYGESWRTNLLKQVANGDIVFLFKKGGAGYVGAFKVLDKVILEGKDRIDENLLKYDIYEGIDDGASLVASLIVVPIAYNYIGVGYKSVRRRTIERMNDKESIKYLLERFNLENLEENRKIGNEKLNESITISEKLDKTYFTEVYKKVVV